MGEQKSQILFNGVSISRLILYNDFNNNDFAHLKDNSPKAHVFEGFATELDLLKSSVQFQQLKVQNEGL